MVKNNARVARRSYEPIWPAGFFGHSAFNFRRGRVVVRSFEKLEIHSRHDGGTNQGLHFSRKITNGIDGLHARGFGNDGKKMNWLETAFRFLTGKPPKETERASKEREDAFDCLKTEVTAFRQVAQKHEKDFAVKAFGSIGKNKVCIK